MRAYPIELRQRVFDAYEAGEGSIEAIAVRFKVSPGFVKKLLRHHRQTGSLQPRPHGGGNPRAIDEQGEAALLELLEERNDRILIELTSLLRDRYGIHASLSSVDRALRRMGITRKKRRSGPPSRTA